MRRSGLVPGTGCSRSRPETERAKWTFRDGFGARTPRKLFHSLSVVAFFFSFPPWPQQVRAPTENETKKRKAQSVSAAGAGTEIRRRFDGLRGGAIRLKWVRERWIPVDHVPRVKCVRVCLCCVGLTFFGASRRKLWIRVQPGDEDCACPPRGIVRVASEDAVFLCVRKSRKKCQNSASC